MISIIILSIVVIAGDLYGHNGSNSENYEDQHGNYGYGVKTRKGKGFFSFMQLQT